MMPTLSLLQSSFSIINCSHVTAPGYLQHSLLSLLHLFIICFKHLLTFINICVVWLQRVHLRSTASTGSSRASKPIHQTSDLHLHVREKSFTIWHFDNPRAQSTFLLQVCCPHMPAKCSCCRHSFLLIKNQLKFLHQWFFMVLQADISWPKAASNHFCQLTEHLLECEWISMVFLCYSEI